MDSDTGLFNLELCRAAGESFVNQQIADDGEMRRAEKTNREKWQLQDDKAIT